MTLREFGCRPSVPKEKAELAAMLPKRATLSKNIIKKNLGNVSLFNNSYYRIRPIGVSRLATQVLRNGINYQIN